jgi:hypothetical protein
MEWNPHPCPKCNRRLSASGTVGLGDGAEIPVYQCDECLEELDLKDGGPKLEMALTFAVDALGTVHKNITQL